MKQITLKTYSIGELKGEAKERAINDNRYINVDESWWYEPIVEAWTEKLEKYGFEDAHIYFTGFYSQGDGACFRANVNLVRLMRYLKASAPQIKKAGELLERGEIEAIILDLGGHYSHERTKRFTFTEDEPADIINDIEPKAEALRLKLCGQIYEELRAEYEGATENDAIEETLSVNEYAFLSDGRQFVAPKATK